MSLRIKQLERATEPAWDRFVSENPAGTFFHLSGWRDVIERAFGHSSYYAFAEQDGAITGVLPLVHIKSRLFGNNLISSPFCVYGGPVASDRESLLGLIGNAETLMSRLAADGIEFRTQRPAAAEWQTRSDLYVTFRRAIGDSAERNFGAIPRKQRAMVRKGIQNGLQARIDRATDGLYRIYSESVRNLGTPVFSRSYFKLLHDRFRDCSEVLTVVDDGDAIAAVMSFYFRDDVLPYYGGSVPRARQRAANDFMYWEVMSRAAARGVRLFDFGRSKIGTGSFAFKKNWGFSPEPLHYQYRMRPGRPIPDHNPLNPKYRLLVAAWKRLPLPLANIVGPAIVRNIG